MISVWHFFWFFCYINLLSSQFDHRIYDEKQVKSIIALSAIYKFKYIHKIIQLVALKCTLDISCSTHMKIKKIIDNWWIKIRSHLAPFWRPPTVNSELIVKGLKWMGAGGQSVSLLCFHVLDTCINVYYK